MITAFSKDPSNPLIPHFECPKCGQVFDDLSDNPLSFAEQDFTCETCGHTFYVMRCLMPRYTCTPF